MSDTNEPAMTPRTAAATRRRTAAAVMFAALSIATTGCGYNRSTPPTSRPEGGVLIAEDGSAYIALASCASYEVSEIEMQYIPEEFAEPTVALLYTFDPPVPRSQALGALDPNATIAGAERTVFDQTQFDLAMSTVHDNDYPRADVTVRYLNTDGEPDALGTVWWADVNTPKSWNQTTQLDKNAIDWKCDDEPAWDFSVVSR